MSDAIREAFEALEQARHKFELCGAMFEFDTVKAALQSSQTAPAVPDRDWLSGLAEEWRTYAHNNENASETHKERGEANCAEVSWNRAVVFAQCADAVEAILAAAPQPDHSPDAGKVVDECRRVLDRLNSSDPDFDDCADAAALIVRLQSELSGPDGFATWKDAALHERKMRLSTDAGKVVGDHYDLGVALSRHFDELRDSETGRIAFDPCDSNDIDEVLEIIGAHLSSSPTTDDGKVVHDEPLGWVVKREGDSTFPRFYFDRLHAENMVREVELLPHATMHPVCTHPAESREEIQAQALEKFADDMKAKSDGAMTVRLATIADWAETYARTEASRLRASQQEGGEA